MISENRKANIEFVKELIDHGNYDWNKYISYLRNPLYNKLSKETITEIQQYIIEQRLKGEL